MTDKTDFITRAMSAHFRHSKMYQVEISRSATNAEHWRVRILFGRKYVVLDGDDGIEAVYRIRPDTEKLRRMRRWPPALEKRT